MTVLGGISGAFGGLGVLVLLQQFAVIYPTMIGTIIALVLGIAIGVAGPAIGGRSTRAAAPAVAARQDAPAPPSAPATQVVPAAGMQAWDEPDPAMPAARDLPGGESVTVIERRGGWANVETSDGWRGWVDAGQLGTPAT